MTNNESTIAAGGSKDRIEGYEDVVEGIKEYIDKEYFYKLPTNEILKTLNFFVNLFKE